MIEIIMDFFGNIDVSGQVALNPYEIGILKECYQYFLKDSMGNVFREQLTKEDVNAIANLKDITLLGDGAYITYKGVIYYERFYVDNSSRKLINHLLENLIEIKKNLDSDAKTRFDIHIDWNKFLIYHLLSNMGLVVLNQTLSTCEVRRITKPGVDWIDEYKSRIDFQDMFSVIKEPNAIDVIRNRFQAVQQAAMQGHHDIALILIGSVLEYVIEYKFEPEFIEYLKRKKSQSGKGLKDDFDSRIEFLKDTNKISDLEYLESQILRKLRNSIHIRSMLENYSAITKDNYDRGTRIFQTLIGRFLP